MLVFGLISLLSAFISFFIGTYVFSKSPKSPLNQIFLFLCLLQTYRAFIEFQVRTAPTYEDAEFWLNLLVFWPFLVSVVLHFAMVLTRQKKLLGKSYTYLIIYLPALIFSILLFFPENHYTPLLQYWGYTYAIPENILIFNLINIWVLLYGSLAIFFILRYYFKVEDKPRKKQIVLILYGALFGFITITTTDIILPFFKIKVPESTTISFVIINIFFGISIVRFGAFSLSPQSTAEKIISTMKDLLILIDHQGKIMRINKAMENNLGYTQKELFQTHICNIFANTKDHSLDQMSAYNDEQMNLVKSNGQSLTVSFTSSQIRDNYGILIGIILIGRDYTERMKTLQALEQSEKNFRALAENANDGIMIMGMNEKVYFANKRLTQMIGYSLKEMEKDGINLLSAKVREPVRELFFKQFSPEKQTVRYELPYQRRDGTVIHLELVNAKTLWRGEEAILSIMRDNSAQKKRENDLKEALERAERADQLKSAFLANMSHEVRTPLTAINGYIDLMMRSPGLSDKFNRFLNIIKKSGQQLLNILDEVLELSRIEADQILIDSTPCNIRGVFINAVENARMISLESRKNLEIITHIDEQVASTIKTDANRISQILNNLLINAIKFTEQGTIECSLLLKNEQYLVFQFKDTGIGIAEEKQEEIFKPFHQLDVSNTRKYGGTGLGLTIAKKLVELMGGELWLESKEHQGSIFYFTLPYYPIHRPIDKNQYTTMLNKGNSRKILVAEDNPNNLQFIMDLLEEAGHSCIVAKTGKQVVDYYKENTDIDLVLMDIQMPIMDGISATLAIREYEKNNGNLKKPIIAITASAKKEDQDRCFAAGCTAYLAKPIDIDKLLDLIQTSAV